MIDQTVMDAPSYIFTFSCPDRAGILAKVSGELYQSGLFITEVAQYSDPYTERFFSRMVFDQRAGGDEPGAWQDRLRQLATELGLNFRLRLQNDLPNIVIAVSKYDHCLNVLLTKWRSGALPANIAAVVSNHDDCRGLVEWYGIPFYHLPVSADNRHDQEQQILDLMRQYDSQLLVLARYMQILTDDLCEQLQGRAINIHHSFLPSFKGARPYHQAHARGVKVVGATAHYVTADLDEGPIIVQEVKSVNHTFTIEQLVHLGHDIEAAALSHAVRLHCEERVVLNGDKTVILQ